MYEYTPFHRIPGSCHGKFAAQLEEVASFPSQQVTGVGVSQKSGRIFVNFPYSSYDHLWKVIGIAKSD